MLLKIKNIAYQAKVDEALLSLASAKLSLAQEEVRHRTAKTEWFALKLDKELTRSSLVARDFQLEEARKRLR